MHDWATEQQLSRAAVAKRLGVSRATVAGWFLAFEAPASSEAKPQSWRRFHFSQQRPEVQAAIADILGEPVSQLRAESTSTVGLTRAADVSRGSEAPTAAGVSAGALTAMSSLPRAQELRPTSLGHRAAEVVETVTGVTASLLVPEPRGSDRAEPYQYQLVVFGGPAGHGPAILADACEAVANEDLPVYLEHGGLTPAVSINLPGVGDLPRLGSFVVPHVAAARASDVGLLVPPASSSHAHALRQATIVTAPYGGSDPVAGMLSLALGAGHLPAADVFRSFRSAKERRGRDDRKALLSTDTLLERAFGVQEALSMLQGGQLAGAWFFSLEVEFAHAYASLRSALARAHGPLVLIRLSPGWERIAAWRLAAAQLNVSGRDERLASVGTADEDGGIWSADQLSLIEGRSPTPAELLVLQRHLDVADERLAALRAWDATLGELKQERQAAGQGPTWEIMLQDPADDGSAVRFDREVYQVANGRDRFTGSVAFADSVDTFMDVWVDAAMQILGRLAVAAGYGDVHDIAGQLTDGVLCRAVATSPRRR